MRAIRRVLSLAVFLFVTASVASAADPYAEYRIPAPTWLSWSASLNGSGNSPAHSAVRSTGPAVGGTGFTSIVGGYDSDAHSRAYGPSLHLSGDRHTFVEHSESSARSTSTRTRTTGACVAVLRRQPFPWQAPLGFSLAPATPQCPSWSAEDKVTPRPRQFSFPANPRRRP
jgi:hypothetical protein